MIIPPTWNLPESIKKRLGQTTYGRQRAILEEGHLVVVLHRPPSAEDSKRDGVLFWRNPNGDWQCSKGGPGPGGLKRHVQSFAELEGNAAQSFEEADSLAKLFDLVDLLTPLVRAGRNMHAALQAAREGIKSDAFLIEVRDLAYEVERSLDLLLEDVRNCIQHRTAREAENQARFSQQALVASHRLNVLAALFFPLTAVTSLFGMNFSHGLGQTPVMFWLIFAAGIALGLIMKAWVLGSTPPPQPPGPEPRSKSR
jgi:hypothetical protein